MQGPLVIEAALQAIEDRQRLSCEVLRQAELALEATRFEEKRARRHYDAVDPDNRLGRWRVGAAAPARRAGRCKTGRRRTGSSAAYLYINLEISILTS